LHLCMVTRNGSAQDREVFSVESDRCVGHG
jgi:hypothetical protein